MSYKKTKKTTPNRDWRDNQPSEIVIHHWGAKGQKFDRVVNWLCNKKAGVSAHYVVQSGKVCELADPSKYATWHAGNWPHNLKSIGIECRPEHTEGDQQTVAELVADLWDRFGLMPIIEHRDIVATACPGDWDADQVYKDAMKIYEKRHKPKKPSTIANVRLPKKGYYGPGDTGTSVKLIQKFLNKYYLSKKAQLVVDGIYGAKTQQAVGGWQAKVGLEADGLFGKQSLAKAKKAVKAK